jgi:membrane protease YdiL (CAAX protease family)
MGRIALIAILLGAALRARRSERYEKYWQILFGLFIMALAVSVDYYCARFLLDFMNVDGNTPEGYVILKLNDCVVVAATIVLLTRMSGGTLGSLYIQKGRLWLGLTIGSIALGIAIAGSVPASEFLFGARDLRLERVASLMPMIAVFVLANATGEELLFRGLFLQKLEPFFGKFASNFMVALVFTALHGMVTYASGQFTFLAVTFPLALAWGYVMQKTEGVWGSILFHAGADIPIMLGIFSNLP